MSDDYRYPIRKPSDLPEPAECPALAAQQIECAVDCLAQARDLESEQPEDRVSPAYNAYREAADHLREAAFRCDTAAAQQSIQWKERIQGLGKDSAPSAGNTESPES